MQICCVQTPPKKVEFNSTIMLYSSALNYGIVEFYGNCCIFKKTSITFNNTLLYIHSCIHMNLSHRIPAQSSGGPPPAWRRLETTPKLLPDLLEQFELPLYTIVLAGNSRRVFLSCFSNVQGLLFVVVSRSSSSTHSSSFPHPCKQGGHTLETFYSQNSQFSLQFFHWCHMIF